MSGNIIEEMYFLLHSFLMGVFITFIYDMLRVFRRVIRHGVWWVALEDLMFWIASCLLIFTMFYKENNGILRVFAIIGAMTGMLLYTCTVGKLLVKHVSKFLRWCIKQMEKILLIILRPLALLFKKAGALGKKSKRRGTRVCRYWKKRLTNRMKVIKMLLYKH